MRAHLNNFTKLKNLGDNKKRKFSSDSGSSSGPGEKNKNNSSSNGSGSPPIKKSKMKKPGFFSKMKNKMTKKSKKSKKMDDSDSLDVEDYQSDDEKVPNAQYQARKEDIENQDLSLSFVSSEERSNPPAHRDATSDVLKERGNYEDADGIIHVVDSDAEDQDQEIQANIQNDYDGAKHNVSLSFEDEDEDSDSSVQSVGIELPDEIGKHFNFIIFSKIRLYTF